MEATYEHGSFPGAYTFQIPLSHSIYYRTAGNNVRKFKNCCWG